MTYQLFVPLKSQQATFTYALLGCHHLDFLMTRSLNEITDQVTETLGLAMDANDFRLVWANTRGAATTVDRRLSVEEFLNTNRPSWCREQDHDLSQGTECGANQRPKSAFLIKNQRNRWEHCHDGRPR